MFIYKWIDKNCFQM